MQAKKIMLTGVGGQVGHSLSSALSGFNVTELTRKELDLIDPAAIQRVIREIKPDLIIHPAAYTAVDKAESEPELANAINVGAPRVIAEEAARVGAALIHFSTDYVYDGMKSTPYLETDQANPCSVYGKSKLAGEEAIRAVGLPHLILRTSWVYSAYGKNFLKTILRLAAENKSVNVVADQFGAPTTSRSIAHAVSHILMAWDASDEAQAGVYHVTNDGRTSWHGFAQEIIRQYQHLDKKPSLQADVKGVMELTTAEYPCAAPRPNNSCLSNQKLDDTFGVALPSWQNALEEVMQEIGA